MLDRLEAIAADFSLAIPAEHRLPVAIIGAGTIVEVAHLPAYQRAGLEIAGIYDLDESRSRALAAAAGVPVYPSVEDALSDPRVGVVDIAVHPAAQPGIARAALDAGKHVMCQKPLALDLEVARALVAHAAALDRKIAVNQQLRFEEGICAARSMLRQGWIGEPTAVSFTVDIATDWASWPWLMTAERLEILFHSIHYLDAIRSLVGDPVRVWSTGARRPGQGPIGETRTMTALIYPGELRALVHVNHENIAGDAKAEFRLDGSEGSIRGTLGLLYDYPDGRPDTVEVFSRVVPTDGWLPYPITTRWLPDAFAGPIGSLLRAVAEDATPGSDAADNLRTLELLEALYGSMDSGQAVAFAPGRADPA